MAEVEEDPHPTPTLPPQTPAIPLENEENGNETISQDGANNNNVQGDQAELRQRKSTNTSSSLSTEIKSVESNDNGTKKLMGISHEGERFTLPVTKNPLTLHPIKEWTAFDWLKNAAALNFLFLFVKFLPKWFFIAIFLFWRLAYNFGLGVLLYQQSHTHLLTRFFREITPANPLHPLCRKIVSVGMGTDFDYDKVPPAFNAWLCFRNLVDIVLANDLVTYIVFAIAYIEKPEQLSIGVVAGYIAGIFLCGFTFWAKTDAYRVVKDFAWYWGDFFFLVDQKLTFDRVFSISPHPMYTIGYGFYYGSALLSQSSTVLYVSLFAHACQLIFLAVVEDPHIQKTYPDMVEDSSAKQAKQRILSTYFSPRDLVVLKNFFLLRSGDIFTLVILVYTFILNLFNLPSWFYVTQVLVWRLIHTYLLGYVLHLQSTKDWWNLQFSKRQYTKQEAFENWKSVYNLSLLMTHVAFLCCCFKLAELDLSSILEHFFIKETFAILSILLNVWTAVSTFEVVGEFGWFYGDFFLEEVPSTLYYTGIYRFLNNPESVTGFAGYYGLALLSNSWGVFTIALLSQLSHFLFVRYVERPHMKRLYGNKVRAQSGLSSAISEIVGEAVEASPPLKKIRAEVTERAENLNRIVTERASDIKDRVTERAEKIKGAAQEIKAKVQEELVEKKFKTFVENHR